MTDIAQRGFIQTCVYLNESAVSIHNKLLLAHGESAYSYSAVVWWVSNFKAGRSNVEDDPRCGAPISKTNSHNVKLVESLIEENRRITYDILEAQTSLSRGTLERIIHDHLGFKKRASRWVPHSLTVKNKLRRLEFAKAQLEKIKTGKLRLDHILTGDECWIYWRPLAKRSESRAWKRKDETPETLQKRSQFDNKTMFSIFFRSRGPVLVTYFEKGVNVDHKSYIDFCLAPAFKELKKQRPNSGTHDFYLLHDNARPHTKEETISFIESNGIKLIDHPPYSPDLAPCDYWLFDFLKSRLNDMEEFESADKLAKSVSKLLSAIPHSEYIKTFNKYVERLEYCINVEGDYFEHLHK